MAEFEKSIELILEHEGGSKYTNSPSDNGGPTKYGITLKTLSSWRGHPVTAEDVRILAESEAREIYKARYWDRCLCSMIADQTVATKLFDVAVNFGAMRRGDDAAEIIQRAVTICGHPVRVDGWIGPETIDAVNRCDPVALVKSICRIQRAEYLEIATRNPTQNKWLAGWLRRASWPLGKDAI